MIMKHIVLEAYCGCPSKEFGPVFCSKSGAIGYCCLDNHCKFFSYAPAPNEIVYAGRDGVAEATNGMIGFGGEMEPESGKESDRDKLLNEWEIICKKKIQEAYEEFIIQKSNRCL